MYISDKILIKRAGEKGLGVFAAKKIESGELIEVSPYIETPKFDFNKLKKTILNYYWFKVKEMVCGIGLGYTSLYNHSEGNNAEFIINEKEKSITIISISCIFPGEEILINYGYDSSKIKVSNYINYRTSPSSESS